MDCGDDDGDGLSGRGLEGEVKQARRGLCLWRYLGHRTTPLGERPSSHRHQRSSSGPRGVASAIPSAPADAVFICHSRISCSPVEGMRGSINRCRLLLRVSFFRVITAVLISSSFGQDMTRTLFRTTDVAQLLSNESVTDLTYYEAELQAALDIVQKQIKQMQSSAAEDSIFAGSGMEQNDDPLAAGSSTASHRLIRCLIKDPQGKDDTDVSQPLKLTALLEATAAESSTETFVPSQHTTMINDATTKNSAAAASAFDTEGTSFQNSVTKSSFLIKLTKCVQFTEEQLINELKHKGTYNPYFMAWDVRGVLNFFEEMTTDSYDKETVGNRVMTAEQNLAAIEQLVQELNLKNCNLRTPDVLARLYNITNPAHNETDRLRTRRRITAPTVDSDVMTQRIKYLYNLQNDRQYDQSSEKAKAGSKSNGRKDDGLGELHVVPFGCRKRASLENGFLRLCGACQAIRRLPDTFFPKFINEVVCDEDKACIYFKNNPHGKCKQKHMSFTVLRNNGTKECQLWTKFSINVRVSCECFVDERSFFSTYV